MVFPQRMLQTYNTVDKDIEKRKARQKTNSQKQKRPEMKTKNILDETQKACNDKKNNFTYGRTACLNGCEEGEKVKKPTPKK
eukprot:12607275-Ditylum_brightwellii.AAC.1